MLPVNDPVVEMPARATLAPRITRDRTRPSQHIHTTRDRSDMIRVAAPTVSAEVVERQTTLDRTDQVLVEEDVSWLPDF